MDDWPAKLKAAEDRKVAYAEYRASDVWKGKRVAARKGHRCDKRPLDYAIVPLASSTTNG